MTSLELITKYIDALEECKGLDKATKIEIFNLLNEFKTIEKKVVQIQGLLKKQIKSKVIEKYVELNDKIYCLETLEEYEKIAVNEVKLIEIEKIQTEIDLSFESLEKMIETKNSKLNELMERKEEILDDIFSDNQNKVMGNENVLVVKRNKNDCRIILKNKTV